MSTAHNPETAVTRNRGKSKKTPELIKALCECVARGMPFAHACRIVKISPQTFSDWRARDPKFAAAIEEAIAEGVNARLKIIEQAAVMGDWRASAWLLEHCQPEHFAKSRLQVEAVGTVAHTFVIPQATLDQIAESRKRYEQKQLEAPGA